MIQEAVWSKMKINDKLSCVKRLDKENCKSKKDLIKKLKKAWA